VERTYQAAILRMTLDEPGPGQVYALEARKHIATLSQREPAVAIELRWCPAHKGVPGNEKADEWAKLGSRQIRTPAAWNTSGRDNTGTGPDEGACHPGPALI
jgi:hypothetical protein